MVQFTDNKNKDLIVNASVSQLTTNEIEQLEHKAMSFTDSKPGLNNYINNTISQKLQNYFPRNTKLRQI